jgi:hypothetical protein
VVNAGLLSLQKKPHCMLQLKYPINSIIAFFIILISSTNQLQAQDDFGKGIGIQVALPVQNATFSGEDFGDVKMGRQGFYVQVSRQSYIGRNNLGFHSYKTIGLALRSNNINIKEGQFAGTQLKISAVELPVTVGGYGRFFGVLPLGINVGGYLAVPLQYKGTIKKTGAADYEFGNKYEKPVGYAGLLGNITLNFTVKKMGVIRLLAGGHIGLLPAYRTAPEGSEPPYKTPLPRSFQIGAEIVLGK